MWLTLGSGPVTSMRIVWPSKWLSQGIEEKHAKSLEGEGVSLPADYSLPLGRTVTCSGWASNSPR